jgi:L-lactate dehydrogenase complex protein LldG
MSAAREEILARIRAATGRPSTPADADAAYAALPRGYLRAHHDPAATDIAALFAERAADYRAVVERVPDDAVADAITRAVAALSPADQPHAVPGDPGAVAGQPAVPGDPGTVAGEPAVPGDPGTVASRPAVPGPARIIVPDGLPADWIAGLPADAMVRDDPALSARELDAISGVITGCAVAIAETGTVVLDHGPGQGRRALTLVPDFHLVVVRADQIAADIADALARLDPARPHTLISGPSATSDIELIRVEGVHGPRNLHILITA